MFIILCMKSLNRQNEKLGIDIGRVIMAPITGGKSDTSFLSGNDEQAMKTPPSPHAIESVKCLVDLFEGKVWLVSKAGINTQKKTLLWLKHQNFYYKTGLDKHNIRFCFKRHEKAGHCHELGITYFIDDRLDVLKHLRYVVHSRYLFGEQPKLNFIPDWVKHVNDWAETLKTIKSDYDG